MQSSNFPFTTPSSTCMSEDLLFFDTFSHSNSDKENFDLVQFPSPVIIDLIKIVPLGQPIEANIPGNVRLGATNPSKCDLEFFINDLTKQDAHTMTDLGRFLCSDKETDFSPPIQIQTDGLLLRGSYRTLTLAIFGQVVAFDEKPDEEPVVLSAASPPAQTPASPVASERDIPFIVRSLDEELIRRAQDEEISLEESISRFTELAQDVPAFESVNHVTDDAMSDMATDDLPKVRENVIDDLSNSGDATALANYNDIRDKKIDEMEHSNSSDIENSSKRIDKLLDMASKQSIDKHESSEVDKQQQIDESSTDYDAQEWFFNVETYTPKPLTYFPDPSLTLQERTLQASRDVSERQSFAENVEKEVKKVKEMFDVLGCSNDVKTEDWVTLVEDLTNDIANMSLSQTVSNDEMLEFLVQQVVCGLDMEAALRQKQTGFKVRHLKAGLKLATILFHCGSSAVSVMLKAGVIQKVLLLYNRQQMSLPLRLLVFKCLSAACDTVEGVEHMIGYKHHFGDRELLIENIKKLELNNGTQIDACLSMILSQELLTGYQYTTLLLVSNPATRIKTAIGNLIKKIRLYEDLSQLSALAATKNDMDDNDYGVFEKDVNDNLEEQVRLGKSLQLIQDTVSLVSDGCSSITQPIRHLPAKVQFHIKPSSGDSYLAFFRWIKHFRTIECIDFLLASCHSGSLDIEKSIKLRAICLKLMQRIIDSPRGPQFLLSTDCCEQTTILIKNLARKTYLKDAARNNEESLSVEACRAMSLKLAYCFKVLSCIDKLFNFHREVISVRNRESKTICDPEKVLHQLYITSDHPYGLEAILKQFSCIGNLDCILRFLDMPESQKHLEFVRETSIDYVLELVGTFFRLNNNVLEIAEEYLDTLVDLCKIKDKTLSNRIKSLLPWLTPFEVDQPLPLITYSDETFRKLTRVIRKSIPDESIPFAEGLNFQLPPQLITAVRILRQLCISPQVESFIESSFDTFSSENISQVATTKSSTCSSSNAQPNIATVLSSTDNLMHSPGSLKNLSKLYRPYDERICGDLKYHYGIMQLCEQEGLRRLLNTLRELIGNYPRPIYQSAALCGLRGRIVISYIHSVIILIHSITCHLIDAREKEFRDTSIISVILETYSLLSFVPKPDNDKLEELSKRDDLSALQVSMTIRSDNYKLAQQTKKLIVSILSSYTQICLSVSESEENVISKSMWTKMLKEVVDFTLSAPIFFHHGLDVLTSILPPPLTNSGAIEPVDEEQSLKNINHRKLWSAHLHPLHLKIESMISNLTLCSTSSIRALLYHLCNQLCDLSSNAACMVAKTATETSLSYAAKLTVDSSSDSHSTLEQSDANAQQSIQNEDKTSISIVTVMTGTKEAKFALKMTLNLLAKLITNQAFKTAFTSNLQVISKKDDKVLINLYNIIKTQDDFRLISESVQSETSGTSASNNASVISNLIESIKAMAGADNSKRNSNTVDLISNLSPPEELTKINLIEIARKTSDRFNLTTGLTRTYRLKVLLDLNSRAHNRSNESSGTSKRFDRSAASSHQELLVPSSHKPPYAPTSRGRSRQSMRPDSFRSRPQNTSRPPSIHVDDFNDMYGGDNGAHNSGPAHRYGGRKDDYRMSPAARYQELAHGRMNSPMSGPMHGRHHYYNSQQQHQPLPPPQSGGSSSHGNRRAAKYIKLK